MVQSNRFEATDVFQRRLIERKHVLDPEVRARVRAPLPVSAPGCSLNRPLFPTSRSALSLTFELRDMFHKNNRTRLSGKRVRQQKFTELFVTCGMFVLKECDKLFFSKLCIAA